jgi:nitroreductase
VRETELIRTLRSVRQFADRDIPDPVLLDILDVGRWTGSSKNSQPWDLIVVRNRDMLRLLSKCGRFAGHLAGARRGLALVMHGDDPWTCMDEGRLMQNLMLAAWAHGVASCIATIYPEHEERARSLLGVPPGRYLRTMLSMGYPASQAAMRLPPTASIPRGRRPLADVVSWERFGQSAEDGSPSTS